jgi:hypothetical protein
MRAGALQFAVFVRRVIAAASVGVLLPALLATAQPPPAPAQAWRIIPGRAFGAIVELTTRRALDRLFPGRVRDADVQIGEGFCAPGALVFDGTPDAIEVAWQDEGRTRIAFVRTRTAGGRWRTARGVRIGTPLATLERLAGGPITFSGFGWDYGGRMAWREDGGEIAIGLAVDSAGDRPSTEISGDRDVSSDHPHVRRLRIAVDEITVSWGPQSSEHDCR